MSPTKKSKKNRSTSHASPPTQPVHRLETGVHRLDYILKGGLFTGATYVIMEPPGSGNPVDTGVALVGLGNVQVIKSRQSLRSVATRP
jgi:hypothetical protein